MLQGIAVDVRSCEVEEGANNGRPAAHRLLGAAATMAAAQRPLAPSGAAARDFDHALLHLPRVSFLNVLAVQREAMWKKQSVRSSELLQVKAISPLVIFSKIAKLLLAISKVFVGNICILLFVEP